MDYYKNYIRPALKLEIKKKAKSILPKKCETCGKKINFSNTFYKSIYYNKWCREYETYKECSSCGLKEDIDRGSLR